MYHLKKKCRHVPIGNHLTKHVYDLLWWRRWRATSLVSIGWSSKKPLGKHVEMLKCRNFPDGNGHIWWICILYYIILYYTILYDIILYYMILYYLILYDIILYYMIWYYIILYYIIYICIYVYMYICIYPAFRQTHIKIHSFCVKVSDTL